MSCRDKRLFCVGTNPYFHRKPSFVNINRPDLGDLDVGQEWAMTMDVLKLFPWLCMLECPYPQVQLKKKLTTLKPKHCKYAGETTQTYNIFKEGFDMFERGRVKIDYFSKHNKRFIKELIFVLSWMLCYEHHGMFPTNAMKITDDALPLVDKALAHNAHVVLEIVKHVCERS